ncbi:MAG TPA: aminotransferase class I/II-fold pyridoxal phosphate-dependent enzyme [Streptosporangiaceae bacterium]
MRPMPRRLSEIHVGSSPGQKRLAGRPAQLPDDAAAVDFSHGDVDAFPPHPAAEAAFAAAVSEGGQAAYTRYRGNSGVRQRLSERLAALTGAPVDPEDELIITPGTQSGLFLSLASLAEHGDRVGIIEPDYFANRRIVRFLGAEPVPIRLNLFAGPSRPVLDVRELRAALRTAGAHVLCLSNPNNPTGAVLPAPAVAELAEMCVEDDVFVVMDQLYCRQIFTETAFTHLRALPGMRTRCVTLAGPSKTESLSGYRVGAAIGPGWLIDRMEAVLSITSLRAPGYSQRVLDTWLAEEPDWLAARVRAHRAIRDQILEIVRKLDGARVREPEAGSYLFVQLPELKVAASEFFRELADREAVIVTPGSEFGDGFDDFFRINFSQDAEAAGAAIERLVDLARQAHG